MFKICLFTAATLYFAYLSRTSLLIIRSHGFFRFIAWEAILALVLLNEPHWFNQPYSIRQIVSWLLLASSIFLVVSGLRLLKKHGNPGMQRNDPRLFSFEKTTKLVTVGTYRYIRHPMYCSLLCVAWGAFLKDISLIAFFLVATSTVLLIFTARMDELECIEYFGPSYKEYMGRTKKFIPFLY